MVFQLTQYWDVAIDGIQILTCLLVLLFLIRSRSKQKRSASQEAIGKSGPSFNGEVLTQTLKQQIEQAFANIADTIAVEQRNLYKVLSSKGFGKEVYGILQYQSLRHPSSGQEIATIANPNHGSGSDQLHEQIQKLAVKGLSARQISDELKTPLGEVELVLSLRTSLEN